MATSTGVSLSGWTELTQALNGLGRRAARRVGAKAMKKGGEVIADHARMLVPVDTGELQDSIVVLNQKAPEKDAVAAVVGFEKPAASRAHFVEFGTVKMAPQPFMRPAIDTKANDAIAVIGAEMWNGIDAEAKRAKKGKL